MLKKKKRFQAPNAEGIGWIPGRGTKILHATHTHTKKSFPGIPFNSDEGKRSQGTQCLH